MNIVEIFWRFLLLGCISFGGPASHIGYFQRTFVQKLKWIDAEAYARLISLCQFLPGPASSQIGFSLGLHRAGIWGGVAAFAGFTLPSFLLMYFLAMTRTDQSSGAIVSGVAHGLKLLAVVVVADATVSMFKSFCKEKSSMALAVSTAVVMLVSPGIWIQGGLLLAAAIAGLFFSRQGAAAAHAPIRIKWLPFGLFTILFAAAPLLAMWSDRAGLFADFYLSGSLVFGGGHVVLPLLQQFVSGALSTDRFIAGYAAAQAVPGPMFSVAAFLGAELSPGYAFFGAITALFAIFLPGFLLVLSVHQAWENLARRPQVAGAVWGINAAVVGLLMATLYKPLFVSAVRMPGEMALVMAGFFVLHVMKIPILVLVAGAMAIGVVLV